MIAVAGDPPVRGGRGPAASWMFLGSAALGTVLYTVLGREAGSPIFVVVAIAAVVAVPLGARLNHASVRAPWRCFASAAFLFLVGAVLRTALAAPGGIATLWADAFTLPGYALLGLGLAGILRARRAGQDSASRSDAVVVGTGAVLLAWSFLVIPTLALDGGSTAMRLVASVYPPIDALLLLLIAQIALTDASRTPAYRLLLTSIGAIFVGDLGYSISLAELAALPGALLDAPFVLAYGAMGAAALHPSMCLLTTPQPVRVRPLLRGRLATVSAALVAPIVVILAAPPHALRDRVVLGVGVSVLMGAVLDRTVRAVNQHARSETILAEQATHDALTGLANRTLLSERTAEELFEAALAGESVVVLFLDLDRFKVLNDSWGHTSGDELLVAVGNRLRHVVREHDCVARAGGDEFAVVCRAERGDEQLQIITARIFGAFVEPFALSIGNIVATPSIGVAVAQGASGYTAERLIRDADIAMYRAKDAGRNRWVQFDESMHEAAAGRLSTEQHLRQAMAQGGMSLHYQPIVNLETERISGFEALARMEHDGARVAPDVFIPVAEETGLILPLGRWVMTEALDQLSAWRDANPCHDSLYMSINLSARQLRDVQLVPLVRESLARGHIPASCVRLEITESVLMDDADAALAMLLELRALGVHLSVDDFGTGYSSLGYLKRFPVSTVKIDRSFVAGLVDNADDQAIVRAVIAMAQALNLHVIAEGVETAGHRDCLRLLGCESAQGWFYGRPLPADKAAKVLSDSAQAVEGKATA